MKPVILFPPFLAMILVLAGSFPANASFLDRPGLFEEKRERKNSRIRPMEDPRDVFDEKGRRHRVAQLDLEELDLDQDKVELVLFDKGSAQFQKAIRKERSNPDQDDVVRSYIAENENDNNLSLTLLEKRAPDGTKQLTGTVLDESSVYQIRTLYDGSVVMEETASVDFDAEYEGPLYEEAADATTELDAKLDLVDGIYDEVPATRNLRGGNSTRHLSDDGNVIDIMVLYTRGAMCSAAGYGSGGNCIPTDQNKATIEAVIDLAVQETNAAYELSGIPMTMRLVKTHYEATYDDYTNGWTTTLGNLRSKSGHFTYVHAMRAQYGADFVAMLVDSSAYCGIGYRPSGPDEDSAFSLTKWTCATGYFSFGHEVAHNMGCNHDRNNAGGSGSYNYGYQDPARSFRSIMAYDCPNGGCTRVMRFSNTGNKYLGKAIGDSGADNARWIRERISSYANYRQSVNPSQPQSTPQPTPQPTPVTGNGPSPTVPPTSEPQISPPGALIASMQGGYIGGEGNMFDIVAKSDITITNFAVHSYASTTITIEVYKRNEFGSCEGLHTSPGAWELIGTTSLVASDASMPTVLPIGFMEPVGVPAGQKQAFYVTFQNSTNYNRYSAGTQFGQVVSSNDDLEFHEGYAVAYKFGRIYYPRVFNGLVYYTDGVSKATPNPTPVPTASPTVPPTGEPTAPPTPAPTPTSTPNPTSKRTPAPQVVPTTPLPTVATPAPTPPPTTEPTMPPTPGPTIATLAPVSPQPTLPPTASQDLETITTMFAGGNGQAGNMFDIEAIYPVTIRSLEIHTYSTTLQQVYVFTKKGSYEGSEGDRTQWQLVCDTEVIGNGSGNPTVIPESAMQAVSIAAGKTQAFYVTLAEAAIRYTNGAISTVDPNIRFLQSAGKRYPFGDTYANRIFNGKLHYTVDGGAAPASSTTTPSNNRPSKQVLTTYANRNGSYGSMFTVEAKEDVVIHNMYIHTFHRPGTTVQVEVYKMSQLDASYLNANDKIDQWQLVGTATVEGQGTGNPTMLPAGTLTEISVPKGHTQSLYVTIVGGGLRYSNGASSSLNNLLPHTSNDDLVIYEGVGIGAPRFGGMFPFRVFNGVLEYYTPSLDADVTVSTSVADLMSSQGKTGDRCTSNSFCQSNLCGHLVDNGSRAFADGTLNRIHTTGGHRQRHGQHAGRNLRTDMVCLENNEIHQDDGEFSSSHQEEHT